MPAGGCVGPEVPCLLVAEDLIASGLMREEKIAVKQRCWCWWHPKPFFILWTHFSQHLFTDRALVVGRPSSELPTFSLDWLCWQCQQLSIKKVVFEEVRRQYLIFEAEYASDFVLSILSIKWSIYKKLSQDIVENDKKSPCTVYQKFAFFQSKEKLSKW